MSAPAPLVTDLAALLADQGGVSYREALRVPALTLGLFVAAAGHRDSQAPHERDEVYVVLTGRAVLVVDGVRAPVAAGSVAYVPAGSDHRFEDVTEGLHVLVVFAPPLPGATSPSG